MWFLHSYHLHCYLKRGPDKHLSGMGGLQSWDINPIYRRVDVLDNTHGSSTRLDGPWIERGESTSK